MSVEENECGDTLPGCVTTELEESAIAGAVLTTSLRPSAEKALNNNQDAVTLSTPPTLPTSDGTAAVAAPTSAKEESDVFRIQRQSDWTPSDFVTSATNREISIISSSSKQTMSPHGETTSSTAAVDDSSNNTDALARAAAVNKSDVKAWGVVTLEVQEIAGNVCVVFPSSASFPEFTINQSTELTAATTNPTAAPAVAPAVPPSGPVPIVALHPAFSKTNKGAENTARALDSIFRLIYTSNTATTNSNSVCASSGALLSAAFFDVAEQIKDQGISIELNCLQRLKCLLQRVSDNRTPSLLLFILLVRIEVAVYLAFRRTSVEGKKGKSKGNAKKPATMTETNFPVEMMKAGRLDVDKLVALVGMLEDITNLAHMVDKSKLNNVMAPLLEGGYCSMDGIHKGKTSSSKLQNILVTPLPALIRLLITAEASSRPTLKAWDSAWTNTLRRLMELAKSFNKISDAEVNPCPSTPQDSQSQDDGWMDTNSCTPPSAQTNTSSAKKKKKKNRRKRRRCSNPGNNLSESAPSNTDELDDSFTGEASAASRLPKPEDSKEIASSTMLTNAGGAEVTMENLSVPETGGLTVNDQEILNSGTSIAEISTVGEIADHDAVKSGTEAEVDDKVRLDKNNAISFDDRKLPLSMSEETASTKTESTKQDELHAEAKADMTRMKGDLTVSRAHGVGTVVVAPSTFEVAQTLQKANGEAESTPKEDSNAAAEGSNDEWETVGVKVRGNRKKSGRGAATNQAYGSNANTQHHGLKKSKSRRTKETRKRQHHGKMVKEILMAVLDSVDEEIKRRRYLETQEQNTGGSASTPAAWREPGRKPGLPIATKNEGKVRDRVVVSSTVAVQTKVPPTATPPAAKVANHVTSLSPDKGARPSRAMQKNTASSPVKGARGQGAGADQNTAPTIPETVSAVSDPRRAAASGERDITRSDSSSTVTTDDNRKQDRTAIPTKKASSPAPPLPTLLTPENANSASSSVASSLEAPHASHGRHHTSTSTEIDVGYHLLDVCHRLTRDMHLFMTRRATALSTRRRERGALLAALQESVSSIWSGQSHVELYGSCATMLDLPSSDLDVVVCGLDHVEALINKQISPTKNGASFKGKASESIVHDKITLDSQGLHRQHPLPPYMPVSPNADRVMRLAADLERQPWAVHVKAIPTATVPVVKVLADPSRLPGALPPYDIGSEEWALQQPLAGPQSGPLFPMSSHGDSPSGESLQSGQHFQPEIATPVWRGADVINGLLKLDITFEGPEHGGIGSTEFSQRVVQSVCQETGLAAESTAFVQVVLVCKELLAQRRLNEPFSGGLSSYALLLLVLAVMCERKIIGEELERVERQRRAVEAGGGNSEVPGTPRGERKPDKKVPNVSESDHGITHAQFTPAVSADTVGTNHKANAGLAKNNKKNNGPSNESQKTKQGLNKTQKSSSQSEKQEWLGSQHRERNSPKGHSLSTAHKPTPKTASSAIASAPSEKKPSNNPGNSWASIAMGKTNDSVAASAGKGHSTQQKKSPQASKPGSFADAVARNSGISPTLVKGPASASTKANDALSKKADPREEKKTKLSQNGPIKSEGNSNNLFTKTASESVDNSKQLSGTGGTNEAITGEAERKVEADEKTSKFNNYSSEPVASVISPSQSVFPQGFNDIIEVLCSGETTPGKLLMHVLLFYGQHFDAHATAIDISGKHHRDITTQNPPYTHLSPYIHRRSPGIIDPITGMLTVDPIVVYDPLEGAENNNVARRCFLWSNVKWVFAQSYMTLSSAVERNTTPPGTPGSGARNETSGVGRTSSISNQGSNEGADAVTWSGPYNASEKDRLFDPSSPLLELLLSF